MPCLNPIVLRSGITVPCGKCDICRSDLRTQWSIRLAIHATYCDRMPVFITLTYRNEDLPHSPSGYPTLLREHVSAFLKAYKRKYSLTNDKFQYFGCGEHGDLMGRPHYHLLFFGDYELYDLFFKDSQLAQKRLEDVWKHGFVYVGIAKWSGIHYVTKYILKEDIDEIRAQKDVQEPFLIASKGLGSAFLDSYLADEWRKRLAWLSYNQDYVYSDCPSFSFDDHVSIDRAIDYLRRYLPSFLVPVDDGRFVALPRVLKNRLVGHFEHFKDNPLWLYNSLLTLRKSIDYYRDYGQYDMDHDKESWKDALENRTMKIRQRLAKRKHDNIYKRSKAL